MNDTKISQRGKRASGVWSELFARRQQLGHSQKKAAEMLDVPQQTFSDWESGKSEPSRDVRGKLADYLQISRAELAVMVDNYFA